MAQVSDRRSTPWVAFLAGAVVMLVLALVWMAWLSHAGAGRAARVVAETATALPDLKPPPLPHGPKLPDPPTPIPR